MTSQGMGQLAHIYDGSSAQEVLERCLQVAKEVGRGNQAHAITTDGFSMDEEAWVGGFWEDSEEERDC